METEENNEGLSPEFCSEFFNEGVYLVKEDTVSYGAKVQAETEAPVKEGLKIKGDRSSDTLILINYPLVSVVRDNDIEFLGKILKAVNLDIDKIALLNIGSEKELRKEDLLELSAKKIIAFDTPMGLLPVDIPLYTLSKENGKEIFITDRLSDVAGSQKLKTQLWEALKKMYLKQ